MKWVKRLITNSKFTLILTNIMEKFQSSNLGFRHTGILESAFFRE